MLAEFAEWLNKQPKEKRAQIINQFVYVYNTEPNKGEIALLKRTLAKKEQEIGELKSYCDEPDRICSNCSGTGIEPELPDDKEFWEV